MWDVQLLGHGLRLTIMLFELFDMLISLRLFSLASMSLFVALSMAGRGHSPLSTL